MSRSQYTKQDLVRRHPRPAGRSRRQEHPSIEPEMGLGSDRGAKLSLRIQAPGCGGAPLSAVVPDEALAEIEAGARPVDTDPKIRVPGYGWRVVGVRVSPGDEESVPGKARVVRVRVPSYGGSPLRMAFPGRTHRWTETPRPKGSGR